MIQIAKSIFRKIIPELFYKSLSGIYINIRIKQVQANHQRALEKVKKKEKVKVAFFLIHDSVWKYEGVYKLMEEDKRFEPVVVVCPYIVYGEEIMLRDMNQAYNSFIEGGYNVVKAFNEENSQWLDVKNDIQPDLIFFAVPYKLTKDEYYITSFQNILTFYVPYGFMITKRHIMQYDLLFHKLVFRFYLDTKFHFQQNKLFSKNRGINSKFVGYPGIDNLLFPEKNDLSDDVWKIKDKNIKRIIWAPHHTIEGDDNNIYSYSNFLDYHQIMLDVAEKFKDKIQISFKPHPILKSKLYKKSDWGKTVTDNYYKKWDRLRNGQLNESNYIDLFLTSDAMIHDSESFIIDYLIVNKPSLYQLKNISILTAFDDFGKKAMNCQYISRSYEDVIYFIEQTLINENDILKLKREEFVKENIQMKEKQTASQNIYNDLCNLFSIK